MSATIEERQRVADAAREATRMQAASSVVVTEPSVAIHDAREALFGIPADLFGNASSRRDLRGIVTANNRLRGLGVLFLMIGLMTMLIDYIWVKLND